MICTKQIFDKHSNSKNRYSRSLLIAIVSFVQIRSSHSNLSFLFVCWKSWFFVRKKNQGNFSFFFCFPLTNHPTTFIIKKSYTGESYTEDSFVNQKMKKKLYCCPLGILKFFLISLSLCSQIHLVWFVWIEWKLLCTWPFFYLNVWRERWIPFSCPN